MGHMCISRYVHMANICLFVGRATEYCRVSDKIIVSHSLPRVRSYEGYHLIPSWGYKRSSCIKPQCYFFHWIYLFISNPYRT